MPAAMRDHPHRCHRCGGRDAAVWYPVRSHGIELCTACYGEAIRGTAHLEPAFPVPA